MSTLTKRKTSGNEKPESGTHLVSETSERAVNRAQLEIAPASSARKAGREHAEQWADELRRDLEELYFGAEEIAGEMPGGHNAEADAILERLKENYASALVAVRAYEEMLGRAIAAADTDA